MTPSYENLYSENDYHQLMWKVKDLTARLPENQPVTTYPPLTDEDVAGSFTPIYGGESEWATREMSTDEIRRELARTEHELEIAKLDLEWQRDRQPYLETSTHHRTQPPHEPSPPSNSITYFIGSVVALYLGATAVAERQLLLLPIVAPIPIILAVVAARASMRRYQRYVDLKSSYLQRRSELTRGSA